MIYSCSDTFQDDRIGEIINVTSNAMENAIAASNSSKYLDPQRNISKVSKICNIKQAKATSTKLVIEKDENGRIISNRLQSQPAVVKFDETRSYPLTASYPHPHMDTTRPYWLRKSDSFFTNHSDKPNFRVILPNEVVSNVLIVNSHNRYYPFIKSFHLPSGAFPRHSEINQTKEWNEKFATLTYNINKSLNYFYEINKRWRRELVFNFYLFGHASSNVNNGMHALCKLFGGTHHYFAYAFEKNQFVRFCTGQSIQLTF